MHEKHHDSLVTTFGYTDSDVSSEMLSASTPNVKKTTLQAPKAVEKAIVVAPKAQP